MHAYKCLHGHVFSRFFGIYLRRNCWAPWYIVPCVQSQVLNDDDKQLHHWFMHLLYCTFYCYFTVYSLYLQKSSLL